MSEDDVPMGYSSESTGSCSLSVADRAMTLILVLLLGAAMQRVVFGIYGVYFMSPGLKSSITIDK